MPFVTPALRRIVLPYVPATTQQVENIFLGLKGRSGTLIDLGSGDGRIVRCYMINTQYILTVFLYEVNNCKIKCVQLFL